LVDPSVGDMVRVRPDVKHPKFDWGDATPQSVGRLVWYHEDRAQCVNGVDSRASEEMLIQSASKGVAEGLYAWAVTITTRYP
jgi:hypothetical protein